jgi:hypothetical protein
MVSPDCQLNWIENHLEISKVCLRELPERLNRGGETGVEYGWQHPKS